MCVGGGDDRGGMRNTILCLYIILRFCVYILLILEPAVCSPLLVRYCTIEIMANIIIIF